MAIKINGNTVISDSQAFTTTSTVSATGNITGGNVLTGGIVSATGNIFSGANIRGANIIAQGTLDAASVQSTGSISAVGLVLGNIITSTTGEFGIAANITTLSLSNTQATTTWITGNASNVFIGSTSSVTQARGNLTVGGTISASGNITGSFFIGNGSQLTGIDATAIQNGTANVRTFLNGNVTTSAAGTANVLNVTSTGTITTGTASVSGNVTGGNILTGGLISATGNVTANNITINNNATITGNLTVSGTETIFNVANLTVNDKDIIVANNVTGGANVNGAGLQAGNPATATWFFNNATTSWQSNIGITPTTNGTLALGGASNYWGTAFITTASVTGNVTGGNILTAGQMSATGNVSGGNLIVTGNIVDTGALSIITGSNGNIALAPNGTGIVTVGSALSATGNITGSFFIGNGSQLTGIDATSIQNGTSNVRVLTSNGNIAVNVAGNSIVSFTTAGIINNMGNGVGNIGNASGYFNTIFAKATSAQYADLAEKYTADADYAPGTVVMFGGAEEVTLCVADGCSRVAGVVSTNPSYIMNGTLEAAHVATVALTGRVPTRVTGTVRKGDLMVSAGNGTARSAVNPQVGTVIGKALADSEGDAVIEVVVGRF